MKIHTFVRDTKLMKQNEREAVAKREKLFKRQQQRAAESAEQAETQEAAPKSRKKKNKEAV